MIIMNIFEIATKNKLRFPFKGHISVEDLWDLSIENLDNIYKTLKSQQKKVNEESLLNTKTKEDKELDVKIEIVKHIFNVKIEEKQAALKAKENREKKQRILEILAAREYETIKNKSTEELREMLNELD